MTWYDDMFDQINENGGSEELSRIGELAEEFQVTLRALRFYEDKGLIHPKRQGMNRLYSRRDRARLQLILLGRNIGFSLDDIREMLDLYEPQRGNITQMQVALSKANAQMQRLEEQRNQLDQAIKLLGSARDVVEQKLQEANRLRKD